MEKMPPTDTTPEPAFSYGQNNPAPLSPSGQDSASQFVTRRSAVILLVEKDTQSAATLKSALERATEWDVMSVSTPTDALAAVSILKSRVKSVVLTIGRNVDPALRFILDLKQLSAMNHNECPYIVVLALASLGPDVALMFEEQGAEYLLRAYQEQILETIRKVQWLVRSRKFAITIVLRRRAGHVVDVTVRTQVTDQRLKLGPRLRKLVELQALHAHTEYTTEMIADALAACGAILDSGTEKIV